MLATRYANAAVLVGPVVMFGVLRAWRPLASVLAVAAATAAVLYAVPVVRGIPYELPAPTPTAPAAPGADVPLPRLPAPLRLAAGPCRWACRCPGQTGRTSTRAFR